jgi:hypothetical protein
MVPGTVELVPVSVSTTVDVLIDDEFIASLNSIVTLVETLTFAARCGGVTDTTFGGIRSGADPVENPDMTCDESEFPETSFEPVLTVTV